MTKIYSKTELMNLAVEKHLESTEYPRVGVVISKDGNILATSYRGERPKVHSERIAIEQLDSDQLKGATIYSTLEPCVEIHEDQEIVSCADLIINSGIREAVIGVLDPNGSIYSQGYRRLLESDIGVSFFNRKLRAKVEEETFEYGQIDKIYGSGKTRVPVINSGLKMAVQFSESDERMITIQWATLQPVHGCVDLSSSKDAVTVASGVLSFADISDPKIFRFPSHYARMKKGMIVVVQPTDATFFILVELLGVFQEDILFRWQVRNNA